jgi:hypothetical protein
MESALKIVLKNIIKNQLLEVFPRIPIPMEVLVNPSTQFVGDIPQAVSEELHLKSWDKVSLNNWLFTASIPVLMGVITPQAFHYYLPSLLSRVMDAPDYFDWGVSALLPNNKNHERKNAWWIKYESLFNRLQRHAILDFLDYVEKESVEMNESKYLAKTAIIFWMDSVKIVSVE